MSERKPKFSGRDLGRRIVSGLHAYMARSLGHIVARVEALERTVEQTPPTESWQSEVDARVASAIDARTSAAVTQEMLRPIVESYTESLHARWALGWERSAQASLERVVDRIPIPKDGKDGKDGADGKDGEAGKDGADGGSIEDFDIAVKDRALMVGMQIGGKVETREFRLDVPIYRDVWQARAYEKSDMVTFSGSVFIAVRDTTEKDKPESSPAWKLIVKRGRDGKDADDAAR